MASRHGMNRSGANVKPIHSNVQATVLVSCEAEAPVLRLTADISFWGGVDPNSGKIIDQRHPQYGQSVAGKILLMQRSIGSSSGSSILLELMKQGCGPEGVILVEADLIITLGVVVSREMQFGSIPVVQVSASDYETLGDVVCIDQSGLISNI